MPVAAAPQTEVAAKGFFADDARKVIYIEVGQGQRLVFDSADNPKYVLHDKKLEIRADEVELRGNIVLSSSPQKGDDTVLKVSVGKPGDPGGKGYGDGGVHGGEGYQGPAGPRHVNIILLEECSILAEAAADRSLSTVPA